jgi:hypothetical protein
MSSLPIVEKSSATPPRLSQSGNSPELNEPDPGTEHEKHDHGVAAFCSRRMKIDFAFSAEPSPGVRFLHHEEGH